jgi:ubiquinone/menaquinone biosynthesis C-methylase UbiE
MKDAKPSTATDELVDWHSYASRYDLLCEMNPAYRDLIAHFQAFIAERVSPTARILDVGAGTGNFILSGAQIAPNARWTHLDADDAMNAIASEKYRRALLQVDMIQQRGDLATFQPASFDLVWAESRTLSIGRNS